MKMYCTAVFVLLTFSTGKWISNTIPDRKKKIMIQHRSAHLVLGYSCFKMKDGILHLLLDSTYKLVCGCCGLTPAISQAPGSCSLPLAGPGRKWKGKTERKLVCSDEDNLIPKAVHTAKEKQGMKSLLHIGRQAGVQPALGEQGSITVKMTWEDKHHPPKYPPPSSSFPPRDVLMYDINVAWSGIFLVSPPRHTPTSSPAWKYKSSKGLGSV